MCAINQVGIAQVEGYLTGRPWLPTGLHCFWADCRLGNTETERYGVTREKDRDRQTEPEKDG